MTIFLPSFFLPPPTHPSPPLPQGYVSGVLSLAAGWGGDTPSPFWGAWDALGDLGGLTHTHRYIHTHVHTHTHTYLYIHIHVHTHIHTCPYIHTHVRTHTHTYLCMFTHYQSHTHSITHSYSFTLAPVNHMNMLSPLFLISAKN